MPAMTVKDLREVINNIPDERPVYIAIDGEGNGYKRLYSAEECLFNIEDSEAIRPDDEEKWRTDDRVVNAVVLRP